ncbi:MAG: DUF1150 family protein [Paenirhodobacter sp.]|uniref:DUF1150 family protein n=1 Tax=Paenirhodobacter sp. TaxID=1965326 RepID=UPI003D127EF2
MNVKYDFADAAGVTDESRIVYVRAVAVADLPEEVREQAGGLDRLYGLFDAQGEQLALVKDRRTAFFLARENEVTALSVH